MVKETKLRDSKGRFINGHKFWLNKSKTPESIEKIRQSIKNLWKNPKYKNAMSLAHKGQHNSPATEFKIIKGKPHCKVCNKQLVSYQAKHCKLHANFGERNPNWKGDNITYGTKHKRLYRRLGQPSFCEGCGTENAKRYHWANISGKYKNELDDWIRLCVSCHNRFDRGKKLH
jgi:hypothetical protein